MNDLALYTRHDLLPQVDSLTEDIISNLRKPVNLNHLRQPQRVFGVSGLIAMEAAAAVLS